MSSHADGSVLDFAAEEQKVNWDRILKGEEYRAEKIMKNASVKSARSDALAKAISGSADRTFAMRGRAEDIKYQIMLDVRANPHSPHLWSQITREVGCHAICLSLCSRRRKQASQAGKAELSGRAEGSAAKA